MLSASKGRFKKLIFGFVKDMEERMWEEWEEWREEVREKEKWFLLVKEGKGKEEYVGLKKRQRGLIGSVRLRVTNASVVLLRKEDWVGRGGRRRCRNGVAESDEYRLGNFL